VNSSTRSDPDAALDPTLLASIADLELVARIIVDGIISGLHRSPFHGYSAEFSQYRHYQPGDDLKYVDWKLFARTDRVFTKQYRETTNLAACLALDATPSMAFRSERSVTKFEYARLIAAALGQLIAWQGDAVGLGVYDGGALTHIGARLGQSHFRKVLSTLRDARPAEIARPGGLAKIIDLIRGRGVLLVFSDGYDEDVLEREIRRALRIGHEVTFFHVLSREEVEFPYRGDLDIEDVETGRRVLTNAGSIGEDYRASVAAFIERWRGRARAQGFGYAHARTDTSPSQILREYLLQRPTTGRGSR
jgi:uncharacterized protein (DUF58 family)